MSRNYLTHEANAMSIAVAKTEEDYLKADFNRIEHALWNYVSEPDRDVREAVVEEAAKLIEKLPAQQANLLRFLRRQALELEPNLSALSGDNGL